MLCCVFLFFFCKDPDLIRCKFSSCLVAECTICCTIHSKWEQAVNLYFFYKSFECMKAVCSATFIAGPRVIVVVVWMFIRTMRRERGSHIISKCCYWTILDIKTKQRKQNTTLGVQVINSNSSRKMQTTDEKTNLLKNILLLLFIILVKK